MHDYTSFLATKMSAPKAAGLIDIPSLTSALKPFQRDIVVWALRLGRAAIFAGTGLGKTLQQLAWAQAIAKHADGPVLVLTPLAVAQQTVAEAVKFGIPNVAYAKDQEHADTPIVITNYDRFDKFYMSRFVGIVLDESSIIKAHDSKTRTALIELCRDIPYRLCCTATPAPNDYVELGNHAEFLGIMSQKEMLATWFVHDGSIRATNAANHGKKTADWRLKGHAAHDFWRWVSTWAVMISHPRDLGYDEPGYDLPPLIKKQITVSVEYRSSLKTGLLFPLEANSLSERLSARRDSIIDRVTAAARIVNADKTRPWLIWCNLNKESEALAKAIPNSVEVRGSDSSNQKARYLLGFARGEFRILISKPSIAGWGMNFQHCSDMVFVGLNDSFEQLFQAIRRCWRFRQERPVTAYFIASEMEGAVMKNLEHKEAAMERMTAGLLEHMRNLGLRSMRPSTQLIMKPHERIGSIPQWIRVA